MCFCIQYTYKIYRELLRFRFVRRFLHSKIVFKRNCGALGQCVTIAMVVYSINRGLKFRHSGSIYILYIQGVTRSTDQRLPKGIGSQYLLISPLCILADVVFLFIGVRDERLSHSNP